ncbi:thiosulfate/3-mercaptopyruvate sulfurtransferase [Asanoa ishikariensis]|uniref:Thiosulfate/3-mercaptopyruvate sulfurtransferase n=2 Tax=Asanoa ishikariensis TaxID=137265 RepID=A0A1H3RQ97_9ACTN|nr:thiosulfate/3-mercaptopyruvate sulfurtransferase [Asanoa ishikariensis]
MTVLDARWRLAGRPGREDYVEGHIPGAVFIDLDTELAGEPGPNGRHPLPDPARLQEQLRAKGVRNDKPVVVYDAGDGQAAARAWWILRWAGHRDTRVLDGGIAAWTKQGHPVTTEEPNTTEGDIEVKPGSMPSLTADEAAATANAGTLIDARVAPRFRGEVEPIDPVAGHIPGAVNRPTTENAGDDGRLRTAEEIRDGFAKAGVQDGVPVGAYCGSGVTAAHTVLALHRAGRTDAALYVGSWSDWVTDPNRPVATGE